MKHRHLKLAKVRRFPQETRPATLRRLPIGEAERNYLWSYKRRVAYAKYILPATKDNKHLNDIYNGKFLERTAA